MRHVTLQIDISLDGFVAGLAGETDWVTADEKMNQDALALLETADTILLGRVAYQEFSSFWPFADTSSSTTFSHIARSVNQATKIVFSRTLKHVEWGQWKNATVVDGKVDDVIGEMKRQPGKNMLLYAGAAIASTFIRHGLVDEYRLRVHPVVLGGGKLLFPDVQTRLPLHLVHSTSYDNGVVLLQYRPITD